MMPAAGASVLLRDPAFVEELQQAAHESNKTPEQAQKYARKCLKEIEATPRESWLRPAAKMARFIYTRSYEAQLDINLDAVEELRELSRAHAPANYPRPNSAFSTGWWSPVTGRTSRTCCSYQCP